MKRHLLTIFAAISLLGAGGVSHLCYRSYRFGPSQVGESFNIRRSDPRWWINSYRGRLTLCRQNGRDWGEEFPGFDRFNFKWGGLRGRNGSLYNLGVPHWLVVVMLLAQPAWWSISKIRRRGQVRLGLCRNCGYDLRATPERCPECGLAPGLDGQ